MHPARSRRQQGYVSFTSIPPCRKNESPVKGCPDGRGPISGSSKDPMATAALQAYEGENFPIH